MKPEFNLNCGIDPTKKTMPTISAFYGLLIRMFFNNHAPPHFHVQYAEFNATVDIQSLTIASGYPSAPSPRTCARLGRVAPTRLDGRLATVYEQTAAESN